MKKILILLIILPLNIKALGASSYIAMDLNSNRIFYQNNIHQKRLIASTTKIMTAIVAIENGNLNKIITVNDDILDSYGSAIYINVGEKLKLKDLLYGLMLRSGNDAAITISSSIAGNMTNFANLMNLKAQSIGMKNTFFYNSHGLETKDGKGNVSTSYDMALLTKYAMKNKIFREIFKTKIYKCKSNYKTYTWQNKNRLLYKLPYVNGGKTGFTTKARRTLVTTSSYKDLNVVIVTLNDPNDFKDHECLYKKIYEKYKLITLIKKDDFKIKKDKYYNKHKLYINNDIKVPLSKNEINDIKIKYILNDNKYFKNNSKVGMLKVFLKNNVIFEEPIYIRKLDKPISWWQKLIRWLKI